MLNVVFFRFAVCTPINSPDKEELKALNEQQALMQKALDELIIASI
ncbi:hypothetical protein ACOVJV_28900 [Bacillus pacificus]|nr:hypothetical protein [Bacillus pacificus]